MQIVTQGEIDVELRAIVEVATSKTDKSVSVIVKTALGDKIVVQKFDLTGKPKKDLKITEKAFALANKINETRKIAVEYNKAVEALRKLAQNYKFNLW